MKMIKRWDFHFLKPSSPPLLGWKPVHSQYFTTGCQSTAHKDTWEDVCMKLKRLVRNPPPPPSPRLLHPGINHLPPPCWLAGWRQAGETSSVLWLLFSCFPIVVFTLSFPPLYLPSRSSNSWVSVPGSWWCDPILQLPIQGIRVGPCGLTLISEYS